MKDVILGNKYWVRKGGPHMPIEEVLVNDDRVTFDGNIYFDSGKMVKEEPFGIELDLIFNTKEEAIEGYKDSDKRTRNEYLDEIENIEELLIFMLTYRVSFCGDPTDTIAREVATEKMREFGFPISYEGLIISKN